MTLMNIDEESCNETRSNILLGVLISDRLPNKEPPWLEAVPNAEGGKESAHGTLSAKSCL